MNEIYRDCYKFTTISPNTATRAIWQKKNQADGARGIYYFFFLRKKKTEREHILLAHLDMCDDALEQMKFDIKILLQFIFL
jgi:hypothetical protein